MKNKIKSEQNEGPVFVDANVLEKDNANIDYSKIYELPSIKTRYISTFIDLILILLTTFGIAELLDKFIFSFKLV